MSSRKNGSKISSKRKIPARKLSLLWIAVVSFLLIVVLFFIKEKKEFRVLVPSKTLVTSYKKPSLDGYISYTIPEGWNKKTFSDGQIFQEIYLRSPNYATSDGVGNITNGAEIIIRKRSLKDKQTIEQAISENFDPYGSIKDRVKNLRIDNQESINSFFCGEFSCRDHYFVVNNKFIWDISFECAPNCSNKLEVEKNQYAKDRDIFLNSIRFK